LGNFQVELFIRPPWALWGFPPAKPFYSRLILRSTNAAGQIRDAGVPRPEKTFWKLPFFHDQVFNSHHESGPSLFFSILENRRFGFFYRLAR